MKCVAEAVHMGMSEPPGLDIRTERVQQWIALYPNPVSSKCFPKSSFYAFTICFSKF